MNIIKLINPHRALSCFFLLAGLGCVWGQTVIPPSYAAPWGTVDTNAPGFIARTYQIPVPLTASPGDPTSLESAERLLAGESAYTNRATPGPNPDGSYAITNVLNFSATAGSVDQGLFPDDQPIPGIPGTTGHSTHFVVEFLTFLDLPAGTTTFGATYKTDVNNDDGYRLTIGIGANPKDAFAVQAGAYDPSKGTASGQVSISVATAGIYPVRLIWWSGVRPADFEFYTVGAGGLVNDPANPAAIKAYREATPTTTPYARKVRPFPGSTGAAPRPDILVEILDQATRVDTNTIGLGLNGNAVLPSIAKTGSVTTVSFTPSVALGLGSANSAVVNFSDDGTPVTSQTSAWAFVVQTTFAIPPEPNPGVVDTNASGFVYRVVQGTIENGIFPNTPFRAEAQLSGMLTNPTTSLPYVNQALAGPNPDGSYDYTNAINLDAIANFNAHNFVPDLPFPGIPGNADPGLGDVNQNFSIEALTYLQLDAGTYTLGVNGDDGVVVYYQHELRDIFANPLVSFNGGEADRIFSLIVQSNGVYPFRFVFWNGSGNVNCEWFSLDARASNSIPAGVVLINDPTNQYAIRAWRETTVTRPHIISATPGPGEAEVYLSDGKLPSSPVKVAVPINTSISFTIADGTLTLVTNSVVLKLNDVTLAPFIAADGAGVTTVSYTPPANLAPGTLYSVGLTYSDSGGHVRNLTSQFLTQKAPVNAGPILEDADGLAIWEAEDFDVLVPYDGTGGYWGAGMVVPPRTWAFDNSVLPGFSGIGYLVFGPNAGFGGEPDSGYASRVDYSVYFNNAATYYIWIRGQGNNGGDDSFWVSMDGDSSTLNARRNNGKTQGGTWTWTGEYDSPGSGRMAMVVPSPGVHTINLYSREDGQKIDKFIATTNVNYVPAGMGPAATARFLPALNINRIGNDVQIAWQTNLTEGYVLQNRTNWVGGSWQTMSQTPTVVGDEYVVTDSTGAVSQFYRLKK